MTTPDSELATHARRSAAILVHYANGDSEGFYAVLAELGEGDGIKLILGLCGLFQSAVPMLLTPAGIELIRVTTAQLAGLEYADPQ